MRSAFVLASILWSTITLHAADMEVRPELERTYSAWRAALAARDVSGWQKSTASHRQVATRNLIVSQRQPFPDALFNLPMRPAEIATLRFLQIKVVGNTANTAYFGKVDMGLVDPSEIPDNILILKFVKEATGWKFDTSRLLNLAGSPEMRASLQNGGTPAVLDDPAFAPDGVVPPTAKPCPLPDRIGVLQVASFGYLTKATVNGFDAGTVQDNAEEHIIIGGLRNGENPLVLEVQEQPIPEGEERHLEVSALVLTGDEKKPTIQVFTWKPEGRNLAEPVKVTIFVNRLTLKD
jgi:hypothetical protein